MNNSGSRRGALKIRAISEGVVVWIYSSDLCRCLLEIVTAVVVGLFPLCVAARVQAESHKCSVVVLESRLERSGDTVPTDKKWIQLVLPKVQCSDEVLTQRMKEALDVTGVDLSAELSGELVWLSGINFRILYEDENLLNGVFQVSGVGAYPSSYQRYVTVNKTSGESLNVVDNIQFPEKLLGTLHSMQEQEEKKFLKSQEGSSLGLSEVSRRFRRDDLNSFYVTTKGLVFVFNYEFPHALEALEPSGEYLISWNKLGDNLVDKSELKRLFMLYKARNL